MKTLKVVSDRCPKTGLPLYQTSCKGCPSHHIRWESDIPNKKYKFTVRCNFDMKKEVAEKI